MKPSDLKLKKIEAGHYRGKPYWGTTASIVKMGGGYYSLWVLRIQREDDDDKVIDEVPGTFARLWMALDALADYGSTKVKTTNILNPEAGEFDIALESKGGCCDPGTERYHAM